MKMIGEFIVIITAGIFILFLTLVIGGVPNRCGMSTSLIEALIPSERLKIARSEV